jgi:hypothetical protein
MFNGTVSSTYREVHAPSHIVQDWRFSHWPDGVLSKVCHDLHARRMAQCIACDWGLLQGLHQIGGRAESAFAPISRGLDALGSNQRSLRAYSLPLLWWVNTHV